MRNITRPGMNGGPGTTGGPPPTKMIVVGVGIPPMGVEVGVGLTTVCVTVRVVVGLTVVLPVGVTDTAVVETEGETVADGVAVAVGVCVTVGVRVVVNVAVAVGVGVHKPVPPTTDCSTLPVYGSSVGPGAVVSGPKKASA
jgi:hypothetical protein